MKTNHEETTVLSGGIQLFTVIDYIENSDAVIVIVHGLCEHCGRYDYVVNKLNSYGYSVYRMDLRGHGKSEGESTFINSFEEYIEDCNIIVKLAKQQNPEKPIFMLGHSMGGFISASYGIQYPDFLKGQILSGAAVMVLPDLKNALNLDYKAQAQTRIPNALPDKVSRDPNVVKAYRDDPLVKKDFTIMLMGEIFIRGAQWIEQNIKKYRAAVAVKSNHLNLLNIAMTTEIIASAITMYPLYLPMPAYVTIPKIGTCVTGVYTPMHNTIAPVSATV